MAMLRFLLLFVCPLLVICSAPAEPGLKIRVTEKGLSYANDVAMDILMAELEKISIPDVTETVLKIATVKVSRLKIVEFPRPQSTLKTVAGVGMRWTGSNIKPSITANYGALINMGFFNINKHGTVSIKGDKMKFELDFRIGRMPNGRPTAHAYGCRATGNVAISFRGGWDNVLNLATRVFKSYFKNLILAQVCSKAKNEINQQLRGELARMPVTETIERVFVLDYRLTKFPAFHQTNLETFHKGAVFYKFNQRDPPFSPKVIPEIAGHTDRMVYVYITDYLLNSGAYAAVQSGKLNKTLRDSEVPEELRSYMQTTCQSGVCLGVLFPEIGNKFPNSKLELEIGVSEAPHMDIMGNKIGVTAKADVHAVAVSGDNIRHSLVTLGTITVVNATILLSENRVMLNVTKVKPRTFVKSSNLDSITPGNEYPFLDVAVRLVANEVALPLVRKIGLKGFRLPDMKDVKFVDPVVVDIGRTKNLFVVGTNVQYKP